VVDTTNQMPSFRFGGVFTEFESSVYATYAGAITWRDRLAGGTPSDPKLIDGWLKSKMPGMTSDIERRHQLLQTLREMGVDQEFDGDVMSIPMKTLEEAAEKVSASRGANGFKRPNRVVISMPVLSADGTPAADKEGNAVVRQEVVHPGYLAVETRHLKAGLKEWVNILFAGNAQWGITKKGPKSFTAEHAFVSPVLDPLVIGEDVYQELTKPHPDDPNKRIPKYPDFLFLTKFNGTGVGPMFTMVTEPDAVETFIGHVTGPQGPRSNLTRVEVVSGATIHFEAKILRDEIQHHHWPIIFLAGQENGLGAMRSQGYGRFDVSRFERTGGKYPDLDWSKALAEADKDSVLRAYQLGKKKLEEEGQLTPELTAGLVPLATAKATKRTTRNGKTPELVLS
jgi:hypothetical protein